MLTSFRHEVDGLEIVVLDGCFPKKKVQEVFEFFSGISNWHRESGDDDPNAWHLSAGFQISKKLDHVDPFRKMRELVLDLFPKEKQIPYRAYCNLTKYGDQANAHQDCEKGALDFTCLYYANPEWHRNWGGETLFYNKRGDTAAAINPKPGRIVIFRGAIAHRNGVPCKAAPCARYSVAYKLRHKGSRP